MASRNICIALILFAASSFGCPAFYTVQGKATDGTRGIAKASVVLTSNEQVVALTYTNLFGYYRFEQVPACGNYYELSTKHRRYRFPVYGFALPIADYETAVFEIDLLAY